MSLTFALLLFVLGVAVLCYLPGKLVLSALRVGVDSLEKFTLACVVGLVASSCVYWVLARSHIPRAFAAWPLVLVIVFLWFQLVEKRSESQASQERVSSFGAPTKDIFRNLWGLLILAALGIALLSVLPQLYPNVTWNADGTLNISKNADTLLHIALATELTHTIPPQIPIFAGYPMSYHYGMDLCVAMFLNATHLSIPDLTVRFVPTLFLLLTMTSVFCFSRAWLHSSTFATLVVFLVFFGEDFSFVPGLILHGKADWSVNYFWMPSVFSLFQANPVLPGLALLFAGLICLRRYLEEGRGPWLFLCAFLFAACFEVKIFIAAQIAFSLGIGALVYASLFRKVHLLKVATLMGILLIPLVFAAFLGNRNEANVSTGFGPWPYVSSSMEALGLSSWSSSVFSFVLLGLPTFLVGSLGLRVIGAPAILRAIAPPRPESALRFVVALFVVIGIAIALTCRIVPKGGTHPYNNSAWFFGQSKYVAWLFAGEALQSVYRHLVGRGMQTVLARAAIALSAVALSAPSTIQHFMLQAREPLERLNQGTVGSMKFLMHNANPGDVVLPGRHLLAPVLAVTPCRVPIGYFANTFVAYDKYLRRSAAQDEFWKLWRQGKVGADFLRETKVDYLVIGKNDGNPTQLPAILSRVFVNSENTIYKVDWKK